MLVVIHGPLDFVWLFIGPAGVRKCVRARMQSDRCGDPPPHPPTWGGLVATTCWQVFQTVNLRYGPSELVAHISVLCTARSDATAAQTPRQLGRNASHTQRRPDATQARRNGSSDTTQVRHNAGQTQRNFKTVYFPQTMLIPILTNPFLVSARRYLACTQRAKIACLLCCRELAT